MPFRIRSLLVATDLSPSATHVLRSASALAEFAEAELHVVHAVEPSDTAGGKDAQGRSQGRLLHEQLRAALPPSAFVTSAQVAHGRADQVILKHAEHLEPDLIVIGPHRERSEERGPLATTADLLVRTSDVPCLIVHRPVTLPLRHVLVPCDLSDAAQGALDVGLTWGAALRLPAGSVGRTRVDVLLVMPPDDATAPQDPANAGVDLHAQVAAACRRTECDTVLTIGEEVARGDAVETILRRVAQSNVDLLVLGTHGQNAGTRDPIGGVASAVARQADCPVLLVPPGSWQERREREAILRPR